MDFTFILVEPAVPENIGASARALKTMGFDELRLVNPCNFRNIEAKKLAHGSFDILEISGRARCIPWLRHALLPQRTKMSVRSTSGNACRYWRPYASPWT